MIFVHIFLLCAFLGGGEIHVMFCLCPDEKDHPLLSLRPDRDLAGS